MNAYLLIVKEKNLEDWKTKRQNLVILSEYGNHTSTLKKKASLLNRLKNLKGEIFDDLLSDLKKENLRRFHVEIINNLFVNLYDEKCLFATIHKVVSIIHLYSFDNQLMNFLLNEIKKHSDKNFAFGITTLELILLNRKTATSMDLLPSIKILFNSLRDEMHKILFIFYIIECLQFRDIFSLEFFCSFINELMNNAVSSNIEILSRIKTSLNLEIEIKPKDRFVEIIKPIENEFAFYEKTNNIILGHKIFLEMPKKNIEIIDQLIIGYIKKLKGNLVEMVNFNEDLLNLSWVVTEDVAEKKSYRNVQLKDFFTSEYLEYIKVNEMCITLDIIGSYLAYQISLFEVFWKKALQIREWEVIPLLARIISKSPRLVPFVQKFILKDPSSYDKHNLILIAELYKFNFIKLPLINDLLHYYLRNPKDEMDIEKFCTLFAMTGRFLLTNKNSNMLGGKIIQLLNTLSFTDSNKIRIKNCISIVLSSKLSNIELLDFVSSFVKNDWIRSSLGKEILRSSRFCILLFLQPNLFSSLNDLVDSIIKSKMQETMSSFYLKIFEKIKNVSYLYQIIELLGLLCSRKNENEFFIYLLKIFHNSKLAQAIKYETILILFESNNKIFQNYSRNLMVTSILDEILDYSKKASVFELRCRILNFYEINSIQVKKTVEDIDSFEENLYLMDSD